MRILIMVCISRCAVDVVFVGWRKERSSYDAHSHVALAHTIYPPVTQAIQTTRQNLESVAMAMRGKIMEIQARQQGARTMRAEAGS